MIVAKLNDNNGGILNSLPVLDDKNWIQCNKQMQSLFGFHETFEGVTNGVHVLAVNSIDDLRVSHKDAKKKDYKVLFYIQSAVDSASFDRISHAELAKEACDVLVKYYEDGDKVKGVKLHALRRQYKLLQMGEDEKIAGYVVKVQNLIHLMKGFGETITDKMIVEKVMCTLTPHFDQIVVAIQESNILETLKLEGLTGSLEAHELRIFERKGVQDSIQALQAQTWNNHGGSNNFRGKTQSKKS